MSPLSLSHWPLQLFHSPSLSVLSLRFLCTSPPLSLFLVFTWSPMFLSPCNFCHCLLFEMSVYLFSAVSLTSSSISVSLDPLFASTLPIIVFVCMVLVSKVMSLYHYWSLLLAWGYHQSPLPLLLSSKGLLRSSFLLANLIVTRVICIFLWQRLASRIKIYLPANPPPSWKSLALISL